MCGCLFTGLIRITRAVSLIPKLPISSMYRAEKQEREDSFDIVERTFEQDVDLLRKWIREIQVQLKARGDLRDYFLNELVAKFVEDFRPGERLTQSDSASILFEIDSSHFAGNFNDYTIRLLPD